MWVLNANPPGSKSVEDTTSAFIDSNLLKLFNFSVSWDLYKNGTVYLTYQ